MRMQASNSGAARPIRCAEAHCQRLLEYFENWSAAHLSMLSIITPYQ